MRPYKDEPRGERLRPGPFHPRRRHLRDLADRMREMAEALPAGATLLDFGCGSRPYRALFAPKFATYLAADLPGNPEADVQLDADGRVPLPDGAADCVLSSQVLEHVDDPRRYLGEARRLLRPGGRLVLSTHGIWPYHPDPSDHWRWTAEGLQREVKLAGFEVERVRSVLGLAATSVQLWQDATAGHLPKPVRSLYVFALQVLIGLLEPRKPREPRRDASVYVLLARRP
ncbi:MAG: class I SAM-dependent methyltransferase [Planctomycetota bacterium]